MRHRAFEKLFAVLFLLGLCTSSARAQLLLPPPTARKIIDGASVIFLGKVLSFHDDPKSPGTRTFTFSVERRWKGHVKDQAVASGLIHVFDIPTFEYLVVGEEDIVFAGVIDNGELRMYRACSPSDLDIMPALGQPEPGNSDPPYYIDRLNEKGILGNHLENPGDAFKIAADARASGSMVNSSGSLSCLRTTDTRYNTMDFTFQADVDTTTMTQSDADEPVYIGLGAAPLAQGAEGDRGQAIGFSVRISPPRTGDVHIISGDLSADNQDGDISQLPRVGRYTFEIEKSGDTLTFSVTHSSKTVMQTTKVLSSDAAFLNNRNSRLFIATANSHLLVTNFTVGPSH